MLAPLGHRRVSGTDLIDSAALWSVTSIVGLQDAVADHAARVGSAVVTGAGWQPGIFGDDNLTRAVLDAIVPNRPCIVYDSSFHNACLNSVACALIGLTRDTSDPLNGHFVLDAMGDPTGMLHETSIHWAMDRLPATMPDTFLAGLRAGQAHANRHGITGIIDPSITAPHLAAYGALDQSGELTV